MNISKKFRKKFKRKQKKRGKDSLIKSLDKKYKNHDHKDAMVTLELLNYDIEERKAKDFERITNDKLREMLAEDFRKLNLEGKFYLEDWYKIYKFLISDLFNKQYQMRKYGEIFKGLLESLFFALVFLTLGLSETISKKIINEFFQFIVPPDLGLEDNRIIIC